MVDYSAPNVAKEMHAGHLRTTVIGDALVRMFAFLDHEVIRENHIGDWGRPFGMLIEHLLDIGEDVAAAGLRQGDLDGFYKQANAKFTESAEFQERARERVVLLQSRDPDTLAIWERLVSMSNDYFNLVYRQLGVLLTDDDLAGESMYQLLMPEAYERLEQAGLVSESDGAMVVFPPGFTNRENEPLPLIVRSRAGAFMYATSDLACVLDRVERLRCRPARLRRRCTTGTAPADGVRGRPHGGLAGAADRSGARLVRQRPRRRPEDAAQPHG